MIDGGQDFGNAVNRIFAPDLSSMISSMPDYWVPYATKHFVGGGITPRKSNSFADAKLEDAKPDAAGEAPQLQKPMHIAKSVSPPQVLQSSEPDYTDTARNQRFSGNVQIYLWVEEDGSPSHLQVVRPVGLGLDDAAVEAVRRYKFRPAMQNGKPVKVDLYIDVNFTAGLS